MPPMTVRPAGTSEMRATPRSSPPPSQPEQTERPPPLAHSEGPRCTSSGRPGSQSAPLRHRRATFEHRLTPRSTSGIVAIAITAELAANADGRSSPGCFRHTTIDNPKAQIATTATRSPLNDGEPSVPDIVAPIPIAVMMMAHSTRRSGRSRTRETPQSQLRSVMRQR